MDNPALLTVDQVAAELGISRYRVYRRIHRGDITAQPARNGNNNFLIPRESFEEYKRLAAGGDGISPPAVAANPMMTTAEVAIATGFSIETIRDMCADGRLPYVRGRGPRGHFRIPRAAVNEMLDGITF